MARQSVSASSGGISGQAGATLSTAYASRQQTVTVIDVEDLREFQTSMSEEFLTFSISQFFVAGSFWLGLERYLTLEHPWNDALFLSCLVMLAAGLAVAIVAFRQLNRRKGKIGRIIENVEANATSTVSTPTPQSLQGTVSGTQP